MKKLIKEPLLHFLLLGAALFAGYFLLHMDEDAPDEVVVTTGQIESLAAGFTKAARRAPTRAELKGLIDDYVREEVFNREAIKLGLAQKDTIVRRRLQSRMEFHAEDLYPTEEPSDAALAEYLAKHPEQFALEQRFSFRQVFLNPEKRGERLEVDAIAILTRLKGDPSGTIGEVGDGSMLPQAFVHEGERSLANQFGADFTAELAKVKAGEWTGPIRSGYGMHLVLVSARTEGRLPELAEIRQQVQRDLMEARRQELNQKYYEELLARYRVMVEELPPDPPAPTSGPSGSPPAGNTAVRR